MQFSATRKLGQQPARADIAAPDCQRLSSRIFTIGHSNHAIDRFLTLLRQVQVTAIADVRSSPFSQRHPQFNQPDLRRELERGGFQYIFLGDELGGRPPDPEVYDSERRVDYWRVRRTASFRAGLERLLIELELQTIALLCAEEDPLDCHRTLMVSADLAEQGITPRHVRGDSTVETTAELEDRLFDITGVGGGMMSGLFAASIPPEERAELLTEAYKDQARRKAFRLPPGQGFSGVDSLEEYSTE